MTPTFPKPATLRSAIMEGIDRCENISNPAVIEKRKFTVHVRKLPVADGRGWVVRIIDKSSVVNPRTERDTYPRITVQSALQGEQNEQRSAGSSNSR